MKLAERSSTCAMYLNRKNKSRMVVIISLTGAYKKLLCQGSRTHFICELLCTVYSYLADKCLQVVDQHAVLL
jgi:hypothetical protein